MNKNFQNSPRYKEGLAEFLKAARMKGKSWTEKDYQEILERRKSIPGANELDREDAKTAGVR